MTDLAKTVQSIAISHRGPRAVPAPIWAPLAAAVLVLVPGALAIAFGQPLLLPSLGPTALLQAAEPQQRASRFYNACVGHLLGVVAAFLGVALLHAEVAPVALLQQPLPAVRLYAAATAMALLVLLQLLTRSLHPPAAATALLIALGGFDTTWEAAGTLVLGIGITALCGEVVRRVRLAQPGQQ